MASLPHGEHGEGHGLLDLLYGRGIATRMRAMLKLRKARRIALFLSFPRAFSREGHSDRFPRNDRSTFWPSSGQSMGRPGHQVPGSQALPVGSTGPMYGVFGALSAIPA